MRASLLVLLIALTGCRGDRSADPPIHLVPDMDQQARLDPQEPYAFFWDGRGDRLPPRGTVARGQLRTDRHLAVGLGDRGYATALPAGLTLDRARVKQGQERYGVYCAPCHDLAGTGDGVVYRRNAGLTRPANLLDERLRRMPVGELVNVIAKGRALMPALASQIPAADRWAIVTYVRALQLSQGAPPAGGK